VRSGLRVSGRASAACPAREALRVESAEQPVALREHLFGHRDGASQLGNVELPVGGHPGPPVEVLVPAPADRVVEQDPPEAVVVDTTHRPARAAAGSSMSTSRR
jgi:hypothetical protein